MKPRLTREYLEKLKEDSYIVAKGLLPDKEIMERLNNWACIEIYDQSVAGELFGFLSSSKHPNYPLQVNVLSNNVATYDLDERNKLFSKKFRDAGTNEGMLASIIRTMNSIPEEEFYHIFNQTGMDHEFIGHGYDVLDRAKSSFWNTNPSIAILEQTALNTQLAMAEHRLNQPYWAETVEFIKLTNKFFLENSIKAYDAKPKVTLK